MEVHEDGTHYNCEATNLHIWDQIPGLCKVYGDGRFLFRAVSRGLRDSGDVDVERRPSGLPTNAEVEFLEQCAADELRLGCADRCSSIDSRVCSRVFASILALVMRFAPRQVQEIMA